MQPRHVAAHGDHAHGFHTTGDRAVDGTYHDALTGSGDGLQAGGAEPIDGDGGGLVRKARVEADHSGDVEALLGLRHRASNHEVIDGGGIEAGDLGEGRAEYLSAKFVGSDVFERSSRGFPDGGALGRDNNC